MKRRTRAFFAASLLCIGTLASLALAQTSRPVSADYIVAVVNSEPITHSEVNAAIRRVQEQLKAQGRTLPPAAELRQEVLERLISEKTQLQYAVLSGIKVDEAALDQAEQNLARQSQTDVEGLLKSMAKDGIDRKTLREQLREQILVGRIREREVDSSVRISDQDIDRYLDERNARMADPYAQEINLAQIMIALPEKASAEQAAQLFLQAQKLQARARSGESFDNLVAQNSQGDKANGGQIGLRRADRYPPSFVEATAKLEVGAISDVVRSGAGFHVLKLIERRVPEVAIQTVVQTRARHILLRVGPGLTQAAAIARLAEYRQRIITGKATFDGLARVFSEDGSAQQGGDLGWVNPGMFVPEFESVMDQLKENDISAPTVSRFGVHLIQVLDRRRVALTPAQTRELARNALREIKTEEAFVKWARDIRERAFVEMREPPQ